MRNFSFRPISKTDLPDILRLYAQPNFDNQRVLSLPDAEHIFEKMMRYPDYMIYVALLDGSIVGTFALLIMDNIGHMGTPSGVIEDVAVDPLHQGVGIGREMMEYAIDLCKKKSCYKVVLSSNLKREQAHAFYDSLDFERHGYSFRIVF